MKNIPKPAQSGNNQSTGGAYVSAAEVAKYYSVSERYVHQLAEREVIPSLRIGRKCVRFDLKRVIEALENGKEGN